MHSRGRLFVCYRTDDTTTLEVAPLIASLAERLGDSVDLLVLDGSEDDLADADRQAPPEVAVLVASPDWEPLSFALYEADRPDRHLEQVAALLERGVPFVVVSVGSFPGTHEIRFPPAVTALAGCDQLTFENVEEIDVEDLERRLRVLLDAVREALVEEQASPSVLDENVQFTVYRPRAIQPATWYDLLVFAHLAERRPDAPADQPDPLQQVRDQAARLLGAQLGAYDDPRQDSRFGVPQDGEITVLPEVEGIEFNPPRRVFRWQEDVHREDFRLRAGPALVGRTARGRIRVFLGVVILAEIDVAIRVEATVRPRAPLPDGLPQPVAGPETAVDQARPYRKIFASYSHADLEIVRQFELLATSLGDEYLRDATRLRSGSDWDESLLRMIDEADVFQLFWSWNSMRSPYVRREWEYAMSLERASFIRPTYWEEPLPSSDELALPPESLRRLHFSRLTGGPPPMAPTAATAATATYAARPTPATARDVGRPGPMSPGYGSAPPPAPAETLARRRTGRGFLAAALTSVAVGSVTLVVSLGGGGGGTALAPQPPVPHASATAPGSSDVTEGSPYPSETPPDADPPFPGPDLLATTKGLLLHIPDAIAGTCRSYAMPDYLGLGDGLLHSVACEPGGALSSRGDVFYLAYDSYSSLQNAFEHHTGGSYRPGRCSGPGQETRYRTSESAFSVGVLRCFNGSGRWHLLAWTHERLLVLALAQDQAREFASLAVWWQTAGPYLEPSYAQISMPE